MIEAFEIGVSLALSDGVSGQIEKARSDMAAFEAVLMAGSVSVGRLREAASESITPTAFPNGPVPQTVIEKRPEPDVSNTIQPTSERPSLLVPVVASPKLGAGNVSSGKSSAGPSDNTSASSSVDVLPTVVSPAKVTVTPAPLTAPADRRAVTQAAPLSTPTQARPDEVVLRTAPAAKPTTENTVTLHSLFAAPSTTSAPPSSWKADIAEMPLHWRALTPEAPVVIPPTVDIERPPFENLHAPVVDPRAVVIDPLPRPTAPYTPRRVEPPRMAASSVSTTDSNIRDDRPMRGRAERFDLENSVAGVGTDRGAGSPIQGDVFLDGTLVGRWMSRFMNHQAERASVGPTGFDARRGRLLPGPTVGG